VDLIASLTFFGVKPDILAAAAMAGDGLRPGFFDDIGCSASDIVGVLLLYNSTQAARCSLRCGVVSSARCRFSVISTNLV
jgi:hypothetical protein